MSSAIIHQLGIPKSGSVGATVGVPLRERAAASETDTAYRGTERKESGLFGKLIELAEGGNFGKVILNSFGLVGLLFDNLGRTVFDINIGFKDKIEGVHNNFIFQPNHKDYFPPPDRSKIQFEELYIPVPQIASSYKDIRLETLSENESRLHGYYFPKPDAEVTMIYLHGYNGSADECHVNCLEMQKYIPANMLIVDYMGFGKSNGTPTREGAVKVVIASYKYLEQSKNIKGESIILCGVSLGGAISLEAAHRLSQMDKKLGGVSLLYPFSSIKDITQWRFPHIPGFLILNDLLNSEKLVRKLNVPIFIAHGSDDKDTPLAQSVKIFKRANEPKGLHVINGVGHGELITAPQELISDYAKAFGNFIETNILKKKFA